MKKRLKSISSFICIGLLISLLMGCSFFTSKGTLSLSLTDAPIVDSAAVEGVYITISSIEYILNNEKIVDNNFDGPQTFNLLELTNGEIAPLSNTVIDAGEVSQIRFIIDAAEDGTTPEGTTGCYIVIDSDGVADGIEDDPTDVEYPIFLPSGAQTGYKATGSFTVPVNGNVEITADFDVRKSVVKRGSQDEYILKPTIRLIVNNQAGSISGSFDIGTQTYDSYTIFVYNSEEYSSDESTADTEEDPLFPNAVTSAQAYDSDDDTIVDSYVLPFLAEGTYDLIVVGVDSDGNYTVLDDNSYNNISVLSEEITTKDISLNLESN